MSRRERRKGVEGEREVAVLLERFGFDVRGLEAGGDIVAVTGLLRLQVECKRQETARPWLWGEQALRDVLPGHLPIVAMRRSRGPWWALSPLPATLYTLANGTTHRLPDLGAVASLPAGVGHPTC